MPSLPIFEGHREQLLGDHHTAEPMTRELDHAVPTPVHAIGRLPVLSLEPSVGDQAAHIAPRQTGSETPADMPANTRRLPGLFIAYV